MPYGLKDIELVKISEVFASNERIKRVILYGSRAKGNYKPFSDIDITLEGNELTHTDLNHLSLAIDDLLLPYQFDISILHTLKNQALIDHIQRVGITIYEQECEWKEYKLGEICTELSDGLHKAPVFKEGGDYIFVNAKNIANGFIVDNDPEKKSTYEEYLKYSSPLNETTILYSIDGTIGNIALYRGEKCILGKGACYINPNPSIIDRLYLYYELQSPRFKGYIDRMSTGSTIQHISLNTMRNYTFSSPPLTEQKRIASILSSLDDKIYLLRRENATLEAIAETLFRQWFVMEPKEEWEEKPLSSVATFLNGLACQKYPPKNGIDKLPVLKIRELSSGIGNDSDWATTEVGDEYIVHAGDVIFAWSASLMVKIWDSEDCILNQHLFKVTSNNYPKWFYYFWCKHHLKDFISIAQSHATTMGHIKRSDLDTAMVLVPSKEDLLLMTAPIESLIKKIESNNEQINTLIQTRDGLLPRIMSNEIKL